MPAQRMAYRHVDHSIIAACLAAIPKFGSGRDIRGQRAYNQIEWRAVWPAHGANAGVSNLFFSRIRPKTTQIVLLRFAGVARKLEIDIDAIGYAEVCLNRRGIEWDSWWNGRWRRGRIWRIRRWRRWRGRWRRAERAVASKHQIASCAAARARVCHRVINLNCAILRAKEELDALAGLLVCKIRRVAR